MKVVLVARDIAPSKALERVKAELEKQGNEVVVHLGGGKPFEKTVQEVTAEITADVANADVTLVGMSSSAELAKEEIVAVKTAQRAGKPYGFYCDTYGCHERSWFGVLRDLASFFFVINEGEAIKVRKMFPKTKVVVSGNPLWEDFCFPKLSREEVRQKLGVQNDEVMILSPGTKSVPINSYLWVNIVQAVNRLRRQWKQKVKVVLSPHPGDRAFQQDSKVYEDLEKFSGVSVQLVTKDILSSSEMVTGCELVIESGSTIGIEAAHQRKPVIDYFSEPALNRIASVTGKKTWEPCELGVALGLYNYDFLDLAKTIDDVLEGQESYVKDMLARQEEVYPIPSEKGTALRIIVKTLNPVK